MDTAYTENMLLKDQLSFKGDTVAMPEVQSHGLWAKTLVMASYDDVEVDKNTGISHFVKKVPNGISSLGEKLFSTERTKPKWKEKNMVPIGGCQYAMEQLFGVNSTQITIPTLYSETGIGLKDSLAPTETYLTPNGNKTVIYRYGHFVQLFGIGITGTAENDVTVHPVNYREKSIELNRVTTDGLTLTGTMLPFRYTAETLTDLERKQYFGKKLHGDSNTGYYLKRFENDPVIKHIWKTGEDVDNETLVSSSDVWQNNVGVNAVESFTECVIRITKKDVKEWFINMGQEDRARINTIALFDGQFEKDINNAADYGDYKDVRLFSKLNIPVEYLSLTKDLNIIYRVYTS